MRDGNDSVYQGKGFLKAVQIFNDIFAPAIISRNFNAGTDLANIDALMRQMEGTNDKSKLGANAVLGISMVCARAGVAEQVTCDIIIPSLILC